jgi:hypothetical protein
MCLKTSNEEEIGGFSFNIFGGVRLNLLQYFLCCKRFVFFAVGRYAASSDTRFTIVLVLLQTRKTIELRVSLQFWKDVTAGASHSVGRLLTLRSWNRYRSTCFITHHIHVYSKSNVNRMHDRRHCSQPQDATWNHFSVLPFILPFNQYENNEVKTVIMHHIYSYSY